MSVSDDIRNESSADSITVRQVVADLEAYMRRIPGLACAIVLSRRGDAHRVSVSGNAPKSFVREMLRTAGAELDGKPGGIIVPGGGFLG